MIPARNQCDGCGGFAGYAGEDYCERCEACGRAARFRAADHERRTSGCVGKICYESKGEAMRVLECRKKSHRMRPHKGRVAPYPYKCSHCHKWHIGSHQS